MATSWNGYEVIDRWPSRCKKLDGELLLTPEHLVHVPYSTGAAGATCVQRVQLTNVQFSKRGAADRAVIMIMSSTGMKVVIEFIDAEKRWEHQLEFSDKFRQPYLGKDVKKEAEQEVKVKLEQQDMKTEEKSNSGNEDSKHELQGNSRDCVVQQTATQGAQQNDGALQTILRCQGLKEQYSYLVEQTRAMTHGEFLKAHAAEICMQTSLPQAPDTKLSDVELLLSSAAKKSSSNSAAGSPVTDEEALAIFQRLPEIEKLYNSQVPLMLKPEQFWTRCLRSRYLAEAFGRALPSDYRPDPLFDYLEPAKTKALKPAVAHVAATADISADLMCDEPAQSEETGAPKKVPLIDSLNEHSAGTLAALTKAGLASAAKRMPDTVGSVRLDSGDPELAELLKAARVPTWQKVWQILGRHPSYVNERVADVNFSLIHYAAFCGDLDVLKKLIQDHKADPRLLTLDGISAEQVARREGNHNAGNYLAEAASDMNSRTVSETWTAAADGTSVDAASVRDMGSGDENLTSTVERRRKLLRHSADALREELCVEPVRKVARLQLNEDYLRAGAAQPASARSSEASANAKTLAALKSWVSSATGAEALKSGVRLQAATKWFLREATKGMMKADRREISSGSAAPAAPDVMQLISRAKTLLRHFWSSRGSEWEMRTRLVDALVLVHSAMRSHPAKAAMESFTPAIDRAVQVHAKLLRQREMDGSRMPEEVPRDSPHLQKALQTWRARRQGASS